MEPTAKNSPYQVNRTISDIFIGPDYEPTGKISAIVQQRLRDDGKMSREFVSIKCELGKKVLFFSVPLASDVIKGLEKILPEAITEDRKIRAEWREQQQKRDHVSSEVEASSPNILIAVEAVEDADTRRAEKLEKDREKHLEKLEEDE